MKFIGGTKKQKISEGIVSRVTRFNNPKKEIIEESTNKMGDDLKVDKHYLI